MGEKCIKGWSLNRYRKYIPQEVLNQLNDGVEPTRLSLYSLPNQYKTVTFDYNILVVRQDKYISVIVNKSDFEKLDLTNLIDTLVKYIEFDSGEVYMMNRNEVPLIYASKANAKETFKSLEVLEKIDNVY